MAAKLPAFHPWTTSKNPHRQAALWRAPADGLLGVIFWGGFNTAMEAQHRVVFCTGCHEMKDNVFVEYRDTIHYNRSGVQPPAGLSRTPRWTCKIIRKVQASRNCGA